MHRLKLSKEEEDLLKGYNKSSPISLMRLKAQAILMRNRQLQESDIGLILGKSERTVGRWVQNFHKRRLASIFSGKADNENASKLTRDQKQQVKKILQSPPSKNGLPKEFWDVPTLKKYVKAEFGTVYESKQSYHFLLKFSDLSFKKPDTFDVRRDEYQIQKRMEEIINEIDPLLKDPSWEVFVSDETRIMYQAVTRKAWLKKGRKTVIKVERNREAQNYIGFLNQKTFNCSLYRLDWQNQDEILKTFKIFLKNYPDKKICVIWDNAKFHKGKKIQNALKKYNLLEKVHLISLPPYAPDMNPIEHVWGVVKNKISNTQFKSFEATKSRFEQIVRGKLFNYQIGHFVFN